MGVETALIAMAATAAAGTAYSIYSGEKNAAAQEKAQQQALDQAKATEKKNDIEMNRANQRSPDVSAIMKNAAQPAAGGVGSTMLTGPGGVNPGDLQLGKNTLLGS